MEFTHKERTAIDTLRVNLNDLLQDMDWYDAHDANLLRFIRAREFDLDKAEELFRKKCNFRAEHKLDSVIHIPFNKLMMEKLPIRVGQEDREGTNFCIVPFGLWDTRELLEAGYEFEIQQYILQILEKSMVYFRENSTPEKIKNQFVIIFDYEHFSIKQVLSRKVVQFFVYVFQVYESVYPEQLKMAFVLNAPKIFEIFWPMLNHVLTAHTLKKVHIFGRNPDKYRKVLSQHIHPRELPSQYGGTNSAFLYYDEDQGMGFPDRSSQFPDNEFSTENVSAGEKFVRSFDLEQGQRITWNFRTHYYDIGFECLFNGTPMLPYARADAHLNVQDGLIDAKEAGNYSLVFDNSYSQYRSKTLEYAVRIEDPDLEESTEL